MSPSAKRRSDNVSASRIESAVSNPLKAPIPLDSANDTAAGLDSYRSGAGRGPSPGIPSATPDSELLVPGARIRHVDLCLRPARTAGNRLGRGSPARAASIQPMQALRED